MNLGFEIKTGKADVAELTATIEAETASAAALETKIEEISNDWTIDEEDLAAATKVRAKENVDFKAEEKELLEVLSMLERATSILSKEMATSSASMLQLNNAKSLTDALTVMVQASVLSSADASRLTALVQTDSADADAEPGAPAAAVYEGHSDGIIGTLEGLTEKAESQLDKARKTETTSLNNFQMLKQSLTDAMEFASKDMDKAKKLLAESQEKKAVAEGDLDVTSKDLAEDIKTKATLHQDCMTAAEEFESATKSRGEELNALATAKKSNQRKHWGRGRAVIWFQPSFTLAAFFECRPRQVRGCPFHPRPCTEVELPSSCTIGIPNVFSNETWCCCRRGSFRQSEGLDHRHDCHFGGRGRG